MKLPLLLLSAFLLPFSAAASEFRSYFTFQSTSFSDPVAFKSLIEEWQPPFQGGNDGALTYNRIETGVRWNKWQLGILERCDYLLGIGPDTAEFLYLTKNKLPLEQGRQYEIDINARQFCGSGLRAARYRQFNEQLSGALALSYLKGDRLTDGVVHGKASAISATDYEFAFDVDYAYSRDPLFKRRVEPPEGDGISLDITLDWHPTEQLSTQLEIYDLISRVNWHNAPYTTATASTDTKRYDDDGYLIYDPVLSGYEYNRRFVQRLPRRTLLKGEYRLNESLASLIEIHNYGTAPFYLFGMSWQEGRVQALYAIEKEIVFLRYAKRAFQAELGADKGNINKTHFLTLQLSYNLMF